MLALLVTPIPAASGAEVLDRILATVNGHPILQSDVTEEIAYEALASNLPAGPVDEENQRAVIERLIDQELLHEQESQPGTHQPTAEQLAARVQSIRSLYPEAATDQGWQKVLARYGLGPEQVEERITRQLESLKLIDQRLRPGVQVDAKAVESYYRNTLLPELRSRNAKQVSLAEASPQIKQLLIQQRIDELLASWLQNLRAESRIKLMDESPNAEGASK